MHPYGIIGIYVFKLNHKVRTDKKHGRNGQLLMLLSRSSLQVNSVLRQSFQRGRIDFVRDPEGSCSRHLAVGEKSKIDLMFFDGLSYFGGLVGRKAEDSKSKLANLLIYFAQLNQLPLAVRSPPTAVEDQNCRLFPKSRHEIENPTIGGPN